MSTLTAPALTPALSSLVELGDFKDITPAYVEFMSRCARRSRNPEDTGAQQLIRAPRPLVHSRDAATLSAWQSAFRAKLACDGRKPNYYYG